MSMAGGAPRQVFRPSATDQHIGRWNWTSDGRAIAMALRRGDSESWELWIVNVDSGRSRKLDVDIGRWMIEDGFHIDRAGKQIAFVANAGQPGSKSGRSETSWPHVPPPSPRRRASSKDRGERRGNR